MSNDNRNSMAEPERRTRRDFLKTGLAVAAGLGFARPLTASGGAERPFISVLPPSSALTRPIGLLDVDSIDLWCLEDNFTDVLLASSPTAIRPPLSRDFFTQRQFVTEHGFSTIVTVERSQQSATLLYDGGLSPDAVGWNIEKLGLPARNIAAVVLSDGHIDHHNGFNNVIRKVDHQGLPLVVHPDAWPERRALSPTGPVYLPPPDRQHLEGGGVQIIERREPSLLLDGMIAVTGEIPRVSSYETGFPPHQKLTAAG